MVQRILSPASWPLRLHRLRLVCDKTVRPHVAMPRSQQALLTAAAWHRPELQRFVCCPCTPPRVLLSAPAWDPPVARDVRPVQAACVQGGLLEQLRVPSWVASARLLP